MAYPTYDVPSAVRLCASGPLLGWCSSVEAGLRIAPRGVDDGGDGDSHSWHTLEATHKIKKKFEKEKTLYRTRHSDKKNNEI